MGRGCTRERERTNRRKISPAPVSGCTRHGPVSSRGGLPLLLVHEEALKMARHFSLSEDPLPGLTLYFLVRRIDRGGMELLSKLGFDLRNFPSRFCHFIADRLTFPIPSPLPFGDESYPRARAPHKRERDYSDTNYGVFDPPLVYLKSLLHLRRSDRAVIVFILLPQRFEPLLLSPLLLQLFLLLPKLGQNEKETKERTYVNGGRWWRWGRWGRWGRGERYDTKM